jgi:hypothetical protein
MNKLFDEQPESAELFRRWAKGEGNPFDDIVDNYSDILEEGIQSPAAKDRLKKAREERSKREAENKAADEAYEKNISETFSKALREFADENCEHILFAAYHADNANPALPAFVEHLKMQCE